MIVNTTNANLNLKANPCEQALLKVTGEQLFDELTDHFFCSVWEGCLEIEMECVNNVIPPLFSPLVYRAR